MATVFKTLTTADRTTTKTLLHEAIPLTGTLISGTYMEPGNAATNVKTFSHGMFQSVYDYPYLSSSANHVLDLTFGYTSSMSSSTQVEQAKKHQIFNQFSQVLRGYDENGNIKGFNHARITGGEWNSDSSEVSMGQCFFLSFARLLTKDEIKKGTFKLELNTGSVFATPDNNNPMTIQDHGAASNYYIDSPAGDYSVLYTSSISQTSSAGVGLLFYQAGIIALTSSVFSASQPQAIGSAHASKFGISNRSLHHVITGNTIDVNVQGFRNRVRNVEFQNTTELNSTMYFCRANHNEFNYSSNPTYLSASKIRVKTQSTDLPKSYVTTIGLYNHSNELMAVAKLSEPLKKDPNTEFVLKVRLDY